jgi:branched-chain amino acid transport system substrate-binding protein
MMIKTRARNLVFPASAGLLAALLAMLIATNVRAQNSALALGGDPCTCGSHPPKPRPQRTVTPYANEPKDLQPYSKFAEPYDLHYIQTNAYSGAARDIPDPNLKDLDEVRIGFLGPIDKNPDQVFGQRMLNGAQFAVDQANLRGGYCGKPFKLMPRNDYDNWQAKQVYGDNRPTSQDIWGSASNQTVKMVYDDKDWAIFGSISSESTHIMLRVALRAEIPIVNSASTDPTIPETYIPWYFTDLQDDRAQANTLARYIYDDQKLKRVALLRVNSRYGRFGSPKFKDASQRLGHPVVLEQRYPAGTTDFRHYLNAIQNSRVDGIVLWNDQEQTAMILKQMHELGMKQRVFGSYRAIGDDLIAQAGGQAEGFEAVFPYDAARSDPRWQKFNADYAATYHQKPEQFASLAYDAMNVLLGSVCEAGLNKGRIMDALAQVYEYDGVTGHMVFDTNSKNIAPMYMARVHNGTIEYRPATMEPAARQAEPKPSAPAAKPDSEAVPAKPNPVPYARVGEDGVRYAGPPTSDAPQGPLKVAVFGPQAAKLVRSVDVANALTKLSAGGTKWKLIGVSSDQAWGKASSELVSAVYDQNVIAVIALDRASSHLAEQIGVKAFVPVIAVSSDHTLTSTNIPWIFRLPQGTSLEQALKTLTAAQQKSGPNRAKLRDELASGRQLAGVRFEVTGEPR